MLIVLIVPNFQQYIHVSDSHIVHLKLHSVSHQLYLNKADGEASSAPSY